ncbi:MAG: glycosyltransferase family 9 protein [Planctomycetota bacterium]
MTTGQAGIRVLVLRPGALGDAVVTEPVLGSLRAAWPDAAIHVGGRAEYLALLVGGADADRCLSYDAAPFTSLFSDGPVRLPHYEAVLAFLPDPDNRLRERLGSIADAVSVLDPRPPGGRHIVDHLLTALRPLDVPPTRGQPEIVPVDEWRQAAAPLRPATRYAVIHVGSGGAEKRWPAERWAQVIERLTPTPVVLTCGPADREAVAGVQAGGGPSEHVTVAAGRPVTAVAGLLADAAMYVGCDSGVTHLAAALGVRTVAVFGPTDPAVWAPRGEHVTVVRGGDGTTASVRPDAVISAAARAWAPT